MKTSKQRTYVTVLTLVWLMAFFFAVGETQTAVHFQTLHTFGGAGDGLFPAASLIQGSDGALYGTCLTGVVRNNAGVFKIQTDGTGYTILQSNFPFVAFVPIGFLRVSPLIEGTDGSL